MGDFFAFRRMIAPVLIHIFYWAASLALLALGIMMAINKLDMVWERIPDSHAGKEYSVKQNLMKTWDDLDSTTKMLVGIAVAIGGPFLVRLYSELLMLPFRINDTLTDIRNMQKVQHGGAVAVAPPRRVI